MGKIAREYPWANAGVERPKRRSSIEKKAVSTI
jgi:hypothetical protein